jgi:hypothetical protein
VVPGTAQDVDEVIKEAGREYAAKVEREGETD